MNELAALHVGVLKLIAKLPGWHRYISNSIDDDVVLEKWCCDGLLLGGKFLEQKVAKVAKEERRETKILGMTMPMGDLFPLVLSSLTSFFAAFAIFCSLFSFPT